MQPWHQSQERIEINEAENKVLKVQQVLHVVLDVNIISLYKEGDQW